LDGDLLTVVGANIMMVLVIGTGSIGRRHLANLIRLGIEVEAFSYRAEAASGEEIADLCLEVDGMTHKIYCYSQLDEALHSACNAIVIANQSALHLPVALMAAELGKALFIEKPLSVSLAYCAELQLLVQQKQLVVEAGFMLRAHPNLQWMKTYLAQGLLGEIFHVRAAVGQWLPDWRPQSDHRQGYGAQRAAGGGVIFDLIHELDLVHWLAGEVSEAQAMLRYVDCLQIETEAIAQINLRLVNGVLAQVHLDYVRPGYDRTLELVGRLGVLNWDYLNGTVTLSEGANAPQIVHQVAAGFSRNDLFLQHMQHFIQRIQQPQLSALSPLDDSILVLRSALACHQAAVSKRTVRSADVSLSFGPGDF
jgi:predicted dehydrogenase